MFELKIQASKAVTILTSLPMGKSFFHFSVGTFFTARKVMAFTRHGLSRYDCSNAISIN